MGVRSISLIVVLGAAIAAVVWALGTDADRAPATTTVVAAPTTTSTTPRTTTSTTAPCATPTVTGPPQVAGDLTEQSIAVSRAVFDCAATVVVTRPGALDRAAALAASRAAPLLVYTPGTSDRIQGEIDRLDPGVVLVTSQTLRLSGVDRRVEVETASVDPPLASGDTVWFVGDSDADPRLLETPAALAGAQVVAAESIADLSATDVQAIRSSTQVVPVGSVGPELRWRIDVVRSGHTNPGGGIDLIDGTRFVAFYGNPTTPALGVLGEQGPAAALARLAPIVAEYEADGTVGVPTFEIIVTVADAVPGADGDYSAEMAPEVVRPWVEVAAEAGAYVLLDLQPGRTDFLTQAQRYEEFLRLPHVGLALDPEWRLQPDEFHLRQIGSVEASEVNRVSEWLAGIVREEALPQKMFLVHQFRLDMIENRSDIVLRPELATVIQMDGQGPLGTKYDTYEALTAPPDADRYHWGWKNFYDEDLPTPTPAQVLDLEPVPVFVSYQ